MVPDARHRLVHTTLAALWLILGAVLPASAQIYSWTDANGTLVLSDRPRPDGASMQAHRITGGDPIATTRPATTRDTARFDDMIIEHARLNSVRPSLVKAVVQVESAFNPYAESPKGAIGLMQLMPATARQFGVVNPFDPEENVRAGVAYLRQLLDRYDGDERLALAAYNAGPGAVDRYGQTVPPYAETQNYVQKVGRVAGEEQAVASPLTPTIQRRTQVTPDGREIPLYTNIKPSR